MESRKIYIIGDINEEKLESTIKQIIDINDYDDSQQLLDKDRKTINIYISTYGGSVCDGLGIYDVILYSKTPIITHCIGKCHSIGGIIFLAGHQRTMTPNSSIMFHSITSGVHGDVLYMGKQIERLKLDNDILKNIIISRTKITIDELNSKIDNNDWYISYADCLLNGIISIN